jgi:hypothetical protein
MNLRSNEMANQTIFMKIDKIVDELVLLHHNFDSWKNKWHEETFDLMRL